MGKLMRYGNREVVRLLVGKGKVVFKVHLGNLCEASPYFTAAFSEGHFAESYLRELVINEDPYTVDLFLQWAYSYSLNKEAKETTDMDAWTMQLAKLYVFADKYLISALETHVISYLQIQLEMSNQAPPFAVLEYVYQNTSPDMAEVREILITWLIQKSDPAELKERMQGDLLAIPECFADLALVHILGSEKGAGDTMHIEA